MYIFALLSIKIEMLDNIYMMSDTVICKKIAANIKKVRLKQNMSQLELADKSGVYLGTVV